MRVRKFVVLVNLICALPSSVIVPFTQCLIFNVDDSGNRTVSAHLSLVTRCSFSVDVSRTRANVVIASDIAE